jgi:hypothetical protein
LPAIVDDCQEQGAVDEANDGAEGIREAVSDNRDEVEGISIQEDNQVGKHLERVQGQPKTIGLHSLLDDYWRSWLDEG